MAVQTDVVAQQYEKWVYPAPILDLSHPSSAMGRDDGDPLNRQYQFWPQTGFSEDMDLLVAGCGSNAAARIAYRFPKNRVVGIDLSAASLAHEEYLKAKHNLTNMTLLQGRLEEVESLTDVRFDYIHVAGVLHHLPDPTAGMTALGKVLKPDGIMFVMLYGLYGRSGVYMLQKLFQEMGLEQTEESVHLVKQALKCVHEHHPIQEYARRAYDLAHDSGIVDTFLHKMDRAYRVEDVLQLVNDSDLTFQGWAENYMYYPNGLIQGSTDFFKAVNQLKPPALWKAMEVFHGCLGKHTFYVCRPDRDPAAYDVSLERDDFQTLIPLARIPQLVEGLPSTEVYGPVERTSLPATLMTPEQTRFLSFVDGKNSVQDCLDQSQSPQDPQNLASCRTFLESLRRMDYLCFRLP